MKDKGAIGNRGLKIARTRDIGAWSGVRAQQAENMTI
jgi:hypothetical protein